MPDALTITTPGVSWVTDLGRPDASALGQMAGGALDQFSAAVANALVMRPAGSPLLEVTALDFAVTVGADALVAVTGAPASVTLNGLPMPQWEPFLCPGGSEVAIAGIDGGLRCYLALSAEIDAPRLLGSVAPDSVLGFGRPLRRGDQLTLLRSSLLLDNPFIGLPVFRLDAPRQAFEDPWVVDVCEGPDVAQFGDTVDRLFTTTFTVGPQSNHVGLRLGPDAGAEPPRRTRTDEILSRGVPIGAVEVPAGRELLVLHRGRGVTAGYPVLAVVTTVSLSKLGQARPGQRVRFRPVSLEDAVASRREQQRSLVQLTERVADVMEARGLPSPPTHRRPSPLDPTRRNPS